jgi:hypothetical protein
MSWWTKTAAAEQTVARQTEPRHSVDPTSRERMTRILAVKRLSGYLASV